MASSATWVDWVSTSLMRSYFSLPLSTTGTKACVNLDGRVQNPACDVLVKHWVFSSVSAVSPVVASEASKQ